MRNGTGVFCFADDDNCVFACFDGSIEVNRFVNLVDDLRRLCFGIAYRYLCDGFAFNLIEIYPKFGCCACFIAAEVIAALDGDLIYGVSELNLFPRYRIVLGCSACAVCIGKAKSIAGSLIVCCGVIDKCAKTVDYVKLNDVLLCLGDCCELFEVGFSVGVGNGCESIGIHCFVHKVNLRNGARIFRFAYNDNIICTCFYIYIGKFINLVDDLRRLCFGIAYSNLCDRFAFDFVEVEPKFGCRACFIAAEVIAALDCNLLYVLFESNFFPCYRIVLGCSACAVCIGKAKSITGSLVVCCRVIDERAKTFHNVYRYDFVGGSRENSGSGERSSKNCADS